MKIKNETKTNLVRLRKMSYLANTFRRDIKEAELKLLKIKLPPCHEASYSSFFTFLCINFYFLGVPFDKSENIFFENFKNNGL